MNFEVSRALPSGGETRISVQVPLEVVTLICGFATGPLLLTEFDDWDCCFEDSWRTRTVQRLRLVSKVFSAAATPFLIPQLCLAPNDKSIDKLRNVARHPIFSKYVRCIYLDCGFFNEDAKAHPEEYASALNNASMFSWYSKDKLRDGYKTYCELAEQQRRCRANSAHIHCVVEAFSKMPNLREVVIAARHRLWGLKTARRKIRTINSSSSTVSTLLPNPQWDHVLEPESTFSSLDFGPNSERRGKFFSLMSEYLQALARPDVASRLHCLKLLVFEANQPMAKLTDMFGSTDKLKISLQNMFKGLTKLDLNLSHYVWGIPLPNGPDDSAEQWVKILMTCIKEAKQLESLALSFPCYPRDSLQELPNMIRDLSFPRLQKLKLAGSAFRNNVLSQFLTDHASTLKQVTLKCDLSGCSWSTFLASLKASGDLQLDYFSLEHCTECRRDLGTAATRWDRYHYDIPSEIMLPFLYGDSFNPALPVAADDIRFDTTDDEGISESDGNMVA